MLYYYIIKIIESEVCSSNNPDSIRDLRPTYIVLEHSTLSDPLELTAASLRSLFVDPSHNSIFKYAIVE